MLIRTLSFSVGLMLSQAALPAPNAQSDYTARLDKAHRQLSNEEYAKALDSFQTLYEDSADSDRFSGVRNSFLVGGWYELGQKYPPALKALKVKRQELLDLALNEALTFETYADLNAFNQVLGDQSLTLKVFEQVHTDQPALAERLYFVAADLLIEEGEHELFLHYNPDPIFSFEQARHERERALSQERLEQFGPKHTQYVTERFERTLGALLAALRHAEWDTAYDEVRKRADVYYGRERVQALMRAAAAAD